MKRAMRKAMWITPSVGLVYPSYHPQCLGVKSPIPPGEYCGATGHVRAVPLVPLGRLELPSHTKQVLCLGPCGGRGGQDGQVRLSPKRLAEVLGVHLLSMSLVDVGSGCSVSLSVGWAVKWCGSHAQTLPFHTSRCQGFGGRGG